MATAWFKATMHHDWRETFLVPVECDSYKDAVQSMVEHGWQDWSYTEQPEQYEHLQVCSVSGW